MSHKQLLLEDLKKNYSEPGHMIAYSGISAIEKFYEGRLTRQEIEDFLSRKYR